MGYMETGYQGGNIPAAAPYPASNGLSFLNAIEKVIYYDNHIDIQ